MALRRGPLIYCVEQADLGADPRDLLLPPDADLTAIWEPELLGGVVTLHAPALLREDAVPWASDLYRPAGLTPAPSTRDVELRAVPYYAWANRDPGGMAVWLRDR